MSDQRWVVREVRQRAGLSQQELADRAGTTQSAIARLESGRSSPTLATLRRLVEAGGFDLRLDFVPRAVPDPVVEAYKRDVDRTLLRENLRKSVDERLRMLDEMNALGGELEAATRRRRPAR